MTKLEHVNLSFGEKKIFTDFSYTFESGKCTAVTGPSGIGKTTLCRLLTREIRPDTGNVCAEENPAVSFQEPRLLPWLTLKGNLVLTCGKESETDIPALLDKVGLSGEADAFPETLSGGMQKRASLARALLYARVKNSPLVILDEPFSGLDEKLHIKMMALLKAETADKTVILITHDRSDAEGADHILAL